jgi:uncharacterized protein YodC (DUF2158 family)
MEGEFKPGDLVRLKSGGPLMTVEGYASGDSKLITCVWAIPHVGQNRRPGIKRYNFVSATLEKGAKRELGGQDWPPQLRGG